MNHLCEGQASTAAVSVKPLQDGLLGKHQLLSYYTESPNNLIQHTKEVYKTELAYIE